MGRLKKDARQVKKAVTIFISDEELFRVKQMAQTWGTNVSQMVAHLINQTFESKAYLNGYDDLSQDEREGLKARRARVNFLTSRRSEAARIRNFDRRNGLDRGLTNVMVVAAPDTLNGLEGKGFPGLFCKNLGDVWIVPYGLLERISVIEIIEYPCYASVFDYFAGKEIPKAALTDFVGSKRDYVLSSFGEKAVLKRLFELYGHLRFPSVRQAEPILREQRDELSNRVTQYQRLMKKLRDVQAQKAINAKIWEQIRTGQFQDSAVLDEDGKPFDLSQSIADLKAIYEQSHKAQELVDTQTMTPHETLAALQSMIPDGTKLDEETLERLQALADTAGEPSEEYFDQLKEQIDALYDGLDTYYDQNGDLDAYHMLDEAMAANTYYQTVFDQSLSTRSEEHNASQVNEASQESHSLDVESNEQGNANANATASNTDNSGSSEGAGAGAESSLELNDDHIAIFSYVTPQDKALAKLQANQLQEPDQSLAQQDTSHEEQVPDNTTQSSDSEGSSLTESTKDENSQEKKDKVVAKRKPGRPAKPKPKVTRIVLPKYLASTAADMASRVSQHVVKLKEQGAYPQVSEPDNESNRYPMPEMYSEEQEHKPFMPKQDFSEYNIQVRGSSSNQEFGFGALNQIKAQDAKYQEQSEPSSDHTKEQD